MVRDGVFRHAYYLRIPFINGDPTSSWIVDPAKYSQADALFRFLQALNVKWVAKTPDYPAPLRCAFVELEAEKRLIPIASSDLESLTGESRIYREKQVVHVTILKLAP